MCITVEHSHLLAIEPPAEVHLGGNAQTLRQRGQRSRLWA